MKTLTLDLPLPAALKFEELEREHGERVRQVLGKIVLETLAKIERSPETELQALEEAFAGATKRTPVQEVDFHVAAQYVLDQHLELYKRLA